MTKRVCRRPARRFGWIGGAMLAAVATLATACGGGTSNASGAGGGASASTTGATSSATGGGGTVQVLHAGSLNNVMERKLGPAFKKATGDGFSHYGTGATKLAHAIAGGTRTGDVYISANTTANKILMPKQESWYAVFARSPIVLAYNPKSKFAEALEKGKKPWYEIVAQKGFKVGATDPKTDPKGKKTQSAIQQVAGKTHMPGLGKKIKANTSVYPETALLGRIQSGQLDAGFFYSIEAKQVGLPSVPVKPAEQAATYTVTVLDNAKHTKAGVEFARFLLSTKGKRILKGSGFKLTRPPKLSGNKHAVPMRLRSEVGTR